jgi:hypothetical protein
MSKEWFSKSSMRSKRIWISSEVKLGGQDMNKKFTRDRNFEKQPNRNFGNEALSMSDKNSIESLKTD